jgi:hypothetical protein
MNNCKKMDKKCEYADRLGMCENITATCSRRRTMRLIDADALKERLIANIGLTNCIDISFKEVPTVDAVPIDYIMQRANVLKETDEHGARVLYGLVMNWNGEEQHE